MTSFSPHPPNDNDVWDQAERELLAKAIAEFAHEGLIVPEGVRERPGSYVLKAARHGLCYRFDAERLALDHWLVDEHSLSRWLDGAETPVNTLAFVVEFSEQLTLTEQSLPLYLEELSCTLHAARRQKQLARFAASELVSRSFQEIEVAMSAGHPCFVANSARLGFSLDDYEAYAPEAARPTRLLWLAATRERAEFTSVRDLTETELCEAELGPELCEQFGNLLRERGLDPAAYCYIPVHPWQWEHRVALAFAQDLALGELVVLGFGPDLYQAQQSIRTLYNVSSPRKCYVKTALSIVNMGFSRGMSPLLGPRTRDVNDWVSGLVTSDVYLNQHGFCLLREVAFVGYRHRHYQKVGKPKSADHKELLSALWRENPSLHAGPGQQLLTMAALLHVDPWGNSLLAALIQSSGLSVAAWLEQYLHCYFEPLVHCFYAHHLTFTPHGENIILVLENGIPVRAIMKDIAEDVAVLNPMAPLPESARWLELTVPEDVMTLVIFTDVFDCVFRFLGALLSKHLGYPEREFWRTVADSVSNYQEQHPEFVERFRRYDLFAPTFALNCLNRLQLRNSREMIDLNAPDPVTELAMIGTLKNPIAEWRRDASRKGPSQSAHV